MNCATEDCLFNRIVRTEGNILTNVNRFLKYDLKYYQIITEKQRMVSSIIMFCMSLCKSIPYK